MNSSESKQVYRRFWRYVRPYRQLVGLVSAGSLLVVALFMLTPLVFKFLIDNAIPAGNRRLLLGVVVALMMLTLLRHLVAYGNAFLQNYIGQRTVFDIRRKLFQHLQLLHLSFYEQEKSAGLVNRVIHDVAGVQQFINQAFSTIANGAVAFLFALVLMAFLNWKLALICLVTFPVYYAVVSHFKKQLYTKAHDVRERQSALAGKLGETFSGIRVVKSFGQEDLERRRFVSTIKDNFYPELDYSMSGHRMALTVTYLTDLTYGGALVLGGYASIAGSMTIGDLVAFTAYLYMLFGPIQNLSALMQVSLNARTGFERVLRLLDTRPEIVQVAKPVKHHQLQGHVLFENVHFRYRDLPTIQGFSLDVSPGEVIALVGPSGSGKSTLISLLARLYDVDQGSILIDGIDLRHLDYDSYRSQIGIVLQESFLFSGTIEENIRYGKPDASPAELQEAARQANALEFIETSPGQFRTPVGYGSATLSGGQRQRISIARAILRNPQILIFDEATSALDTESEALIKESMDHLMASKTVFMVAHRLSTIQSADRIVVMGRGAIAEIGTHDDLLARGGLYHRLHSETKTTARPELEFAGRACSPSAP